MLPARPEGWAAIVCTPGTAPLRQLGQALAPELGRDIEALRQLVSFDDPEVAFALLRRWRHAHAQALVVVDQFEELFTLNPPDVQALVAALLGRLATEADLHVVLSLRDDFLMRCHAHAALAPVFFELTPLGPLTREGLRRAVVDPAQTRGYRFEDEALVDEMVDAVEGARAALPLLAFAVARLWERRDREAHVLTRAAYEQIGGVAGALAQHAEATLDRIGSMQQDLVRELFRNLVTAQGTRAVIDRDELLSAFPERAAAETVLRTLIDARLLTAYEVEGKPGEPSRHLVEIAHESLIKAWPRLVRWQVQDEHGAQLRDQLKQAAHLWDEKGRTADLLWTGTAVQEYSLWRQRYPGALTALEEDFARAMAAREQRRKRLRRTAVAAAFVALAAVAVAIGISRQQAVASARRAEASKLLALAELRLAEDPTEALALATVSLEQAELFRYPGESVRFALSRDGRQLLVLGKNVPRARSFNELLLVDLVTRASRRITTHGSRLERAAFDPSGRFIVTGDFDGIVRVGPVTGEEPHLLLGHTGMIESLAVSPDGRWIASAAEDQLFLWPTPDVTKPPLHTLPHDELLATLDRLTNLRVVPDASPATGWKLDIGPFPGWKEVPTW